MDAIAKMPTYEAYKDSGVEWLGEVPAEWELLANKHIFRLKKSQVGKRSSEYDLLSLTLKGIIKRDMENPEGKFPAEFDTYQEVKKGDFVFCLFDVEETPRTVGLSPYDGMITGAYTVFETSEKFDSEFLYYFYLNLDSKKRLKPLYRGLRNTIPKDAFLSFKTFVPALSQQTMIANFLDQKTAQIDEAIAIKEQQIALLKERKQIIIQKAVTQGLDPDVPMKDSGVDWIGEIPAHWAVVALAYALNAVGDVDHYMPETIDTGVPYFMTGDLEDLVSQMSFDDCKKVSYRDYVKLTKKIKTEVGDVILARYATIGTVTYVDVNEEFLVSYSCVTIKTDKKFLDGMYLFYFLKSDTFSQAVSRVVNTNTQGNVGIGDLKKIKIALPPLREQERLVRSVAKRLSEIDVAIEAQENQIAKLKEYKTTLINSAVTGKIRITPEMVA